MSRRIQLPPLTTAEPTAPAVTTAAPAPVPTESKSADEPKAKEETHYLPFSTGWSGFLQVENALITVILFLLGFSIAVSKEEGQPHAGCSAST